ncbi:unnamed protein product [Gulo gulo]|uniref:Uncharacterized protein n=1 Tax=Gulo gulo TaxID=48420 RepID=A0A9X9MC46_GULGU|nr:unnamed protein product [Gulo gulo]
MLSRPETFQLTSTRPSILPSLCTPPALYGWPLCQSTLAATTKSSPCVSPSVSVPQWRWAACLCRRCTSSWPNQRGMCAAPSPRLLWCACMWGTASHPRQPADPAAWSTCGRGGAPLGKP